MIRTIFGMRGHGKTTLASTFLKKPERPVICLDLFNQFKTKRLFTSSRELLRHLIKTGGAKLKEPLFISIFEKEDFNILCKIAIEHQGLCLILDEVDMFDSPHSQDRDFKKLIHYGRHYKVDLITTSRRPHNISRDLTSQTELFYIFKVIEERDLKYFEALNPSLPGLIRQLPKFEYLRYDGGEKIERERVKLMKR